jgi:hypothetical protein
MFVFEDFRPGIFTEEFQNISVGAREEIHWVAGTASPAKKSINFITREQQREQKSSQ